MTPLRQKMIEAMQLRGFSVRTHRSYLDAVSKLAQYYHRSPDRISGEELQAFFLYLAKDRGLSGASCRLYLNAIRFLYLQVLGRDTFGVKLVVPKKAQRIPELLTRSEVGPILSACPNFKHRMLLTTGYGCGLRVSEVVRIKVRDIDGERHLLRIEQGKGRDGETKRSGESFRRRAGSPGMGYPGAGRVAGQRSGWRKTGM